MPDLTHFSELPLWAQVIVIVIGIVTTGFTCAWTWSNIRKTNAQVDGRKIQNERQRILLTKELQELNASAELVRAVEQYARPMEDNAETGVIVARFVLLSVLLALWGAAGTVLSSILFGVQSSQTFLRAFIPLGDAETMQQILLAGGMAITLVMGIVTLAITISIGLPLLRDVRAYLKKQEKA